MKKIAAVMAAVGLLAAVKNAAAEPNWIEEGIQEVNKNGVTEHRQWWIDTNSVRRSGPTVMFWAKGRTDQATNGLASWDLRMKVNCNQTDEQTIMSMVGYNQNGSVITSSAEPTTTPAPPGSLYANMADIMCKATSKMK
ncbi:surface-adhesin E family protein [Burkholderia cepacia]|uniref:surface-adhesin E family protein n=1 Tax=Burkholderia cepacia TaxID=292 RepID=UPI0015776E9B|nr:hypothetical protein [Burkholderia cepacia]